MCCGVVPILFGWFLRVPSLHALVFIRKTFWWLVITHSVHCGVSVRELIDALAFHIHYLFPLGIRILSTNGILGQDGADYIICPFPEHKLFCSCCSWVFSGRSRIFKRGVPVCTWLIAKARMLGGVACKDMSLHKNFRFQTFRDHFLVPFWGETARVGWPTAKSSHCVWSF